MTRFSPCQFSTPTRNLHISPLKDVKSDDVRFCCGFSPCSSGGKRKRKSCVEQSDAAPRSRPLVKQRATSGRFLPTNPPPPSPDVPCSPSELSQTSDQSSMNASSLPPRTLLPPAAVCPAPSHSRIYSTRDNLPSSSFALHEQQPDMNNVSS
jgi:hypothetical protein